MTSDCRSHHIYNCRGSHLIFVSHTRKRMTFQKRLEHVDRPATGSIEYLTTNQVDLLHKHMNKREFLRLFSILSTRLATTESEGSAVIEHAD